jgi:hypothetical protein
MIAIDQAPPGNNQSRDKYFTELLITRHFAGYYPHREIIEIPQPRPQRALFPPGSSAGTLLVACSCSKTYFGLELGDG